MLFSKTATSRQIDYALLALRISTGLSIAAHGYQKVFTFGIAGLTSGFVGMGIPMAGVAAPFIAYLEADRWISPGAGISDAPPGPATDV